MSRVETIKQRDAFYDILRIIAILFVLYNHRECYWYHMYFEEVCLNKTIAIALEVLCKCGPPLFFMISGALLLGKQESFKQIFLHRICRILVIMVTLTVIVMLYNHYDIKECGYIFTNSLNWYLYAYLAYLLMLPFLRLIAQNMTMSQGRLFFAFVVVFYSLDCLWVVLGIRQSLTASLGLFTEKWASDCWQIIFPLLGYMILREEKEYDFDKNNRFKVHFAFAIGTVFSIVLAIVFTYYDIAHTGGQNLEQINQHSILFPSSFIFSCVIRFAKHHGNLNNHLSMKRVISEIAGTTFGIFLIETHLPYSDMIFENIALHIPATSRYLASIYSVAIEFVLYGIIIYLLRLVKPIRKFL